MSTQKQKFELFTRIQALGFTYEEAVALRRIEMTLRAWATAECNGEIERDESRGQTYRVLRSGSRYSGNARYPIADRETGALRRLKAIVDARNARAGEVSGVAQSFGLSRDVLAYHQTDPRGCALYLVKKNDLPSGDPKQLQAYYNRGVAVCA